MKADEMPIQPQIFLEPFEKWAIDFVGTFNPPSHQKAYILVYTDYVTKWVEARVVTRATEQVVEDFLFQENFARYGTPREIVLDGGSQFTSHMIEKLMQKYGVKHRVTTPYHPQANGQVESINKLLENIFDKDSSKPSPGLGIETPKSSIGIQDGMVEYNRVFSI